MGTPLPPFSNASLPPLPPSPAQSACSVAVRRRPGREHPPTRFSGTVQSVACPHGSMQREGPWVSAGPVGRCACLSADERRLRA